MHAMRSCLVAIGVLLLASCSPSVLPVGGVEYGSIDDFKDAYIAAGGDCDDWEQTNAVDIAAESGSCDEDTVLSTFASQADRDESAQTIKDLMEMIGGVTLLVGENWIVNSKDARDVQSVLGGTIIDTVEK